MLIRVKGQNEEVISMKNEKKKNHKTNKKTQSTHTTPSTSHFCLESQGNSETRGQNPDTEHIGRTDQLLMIRDVAPAAMQEEENSNSSVIQLVLTY